MCCNIKSQQKSVDVCQSGIRAAGFQKLTIRVPGKDKNLEINDSSQKRVVNNFPQKIRLKDFSRGLYSETMVSYQEALIWGTFLQIMTDVLNYRKS